MQFSTNFLFSIKKVTEKIYSTSPEVNKELAQKISPNLEVNSQLKTFFGKAAFCKKCQKLPNQDFHSR